MDESRHDLREAIDQWRVRYRVLYPNVLPHNAAGHPENDTLELPSSYDLFHRQNFNLNTLSRFEYEIRLGHAYDAIDDLRNAIHIYNASNREKKTHVYGQQPGTRAWGILNSLKDDIRECAKRYQSAYANLLTLGLPSNSELKLINDGDLWGKDMTSTRKQGDSRRKEPWYWVIGKPKDLTEVAWELEREFPLFCRPFSNLKVTY